MFSLPPPYVEWQVFPSGHRARFLAFLVATVTYLAYDIVNPAERISLIPLDQLQPSYDFIVVGGGSAGCVVASRLSANPNWTVLLLEDGPDESIISEVPLLDFENLITDYTYNDTTVYQPYACQYIQGICLYMHGRVMGGSGSIADNFYVRGNPLDYDMWAERGNPGWSYADVLPYFRLSEGNELPKFQADTEYHGSSGPLTVGFSSYKTPLAEAYLQAGQELGYPTLDITGPIQTGFSPPLQTIRNGSRVSSSRAFIQPARNRPNLHVSYNSTVTKVMIGEANKTAFGVQFLRDGQMLTVYSTKEVIMSAGGINSPQLLMLSGVGPADHLKQFNIPVIADLPVGQNFQDHVYVANFFQINQSLTVIEDIYESPTSVINYALGLSSPLTMPLGCEAIGYVNINSSNTNINYTGMQLAMYSSIPNNRNELQLIYITNLLIHPQSIGNITLRSTDAFDPPLINPNIFGEKEDFLSMVQGLEMVYRYSQTPTMQTYNTTFYLPLYPLCSNITFPSEEFWSCVAYQYTIPIVHPVRTCAMGPADDPTAVVDSRLRVHGVNGLRVIDASIMPMPVGSNNNAPTVMVAERGAAFIFDDYHETNPAPAM